MTTDLIATHPDNVLFPPWMEWLKKNHKLFNRIHIAIHKKNIEGWCFTTEIKETLLPLGNVSIYEPEEDITVDWRNRAINYCLNQSTSNRVLFMEQDFFIKDFGKLLNEFDSHIPRHRIAGYAQGNRLHPAFLLVDRDVINSTSRDFSPIETDHFGKFSREIIREVGDYYDIDMLHSEEWFHMNGLTQNYTLVQLGEKPNHDIPSFTLYNVLSLDHTYRRYNELCHLAEKSLTRLGDFL